MSSRNSSSCVLFPFDDEYVPNKLTAEFEAVRSELVEASHVKPVHLCLVNLFVYIVIKQHIPCHVVRVIGSRYQLCCKKGVLDTPYLGQDLVALNSDHFIPLDKWHQRDQLSLCDVISDPSCLESYTCNPSMPSQPTIVLSDNPDSVLTPLGNDVWLKNMLSTGNGKW